ARILQRLRGEPAIPAVHGYGQFEHFECMAMELFRPSIAERQWDGAGVLPKTVIRIVVQAVPLHIHALGVVHHDIEPNKYLCTLDDPAKINLIDFGIAKPFFCAKPGRAKYDPLKDRRRIVGCIAHSYSIYDTIDLAPPDDIESLALTTLFLLRGNLPWRPHRHLESQIHSQEVVRILKLACSGPILSAGLPDEFGDLLSFSSSLTYDQLPDYEALRASFVALIDRIRFDVQVVRRRSYNLLAGPYLLCFT
ncbi:hypothetical protein OG21DRAFT_1419436, partial [Imleria badia]